MQLINNHLTELVEQDIVEAEEAISKAIDKEGLKTSLRGKGLYSDPPEQ
jgi:Tfp pilus assembly ATPase PilU